MAILPGELPATHSSESYNEHHNDTQESMFEDSSNFREEETFEGTHEGSQESAYEPPPALPDHPEVEPEFEHSPAHNPEHYATAPETFPSQNSAPVHEEAVRSQAATLLTVDDFAALEDRVLRAVSLVRRERQGRVAAEERAAALETQLLEAQAKTSATEALHREVLDLRAEREQVRQRVDRLLSQLDSLEL
jgi:hypothetical protein